MTEEFAKKAAEIKGLIDQSGKILLHAHPSPDPDSYGSALAMLHYLEAVGKSVTLIKGDSPVPDFVEFLPGHDKVVDKNYLEIDPSEFDLFIILDVNGPDRVSALGSVIFPPTMKTVLIDHHATVAAPFATISLVDSSYPATAELLHDLFCAWGNIFTEEMAECLMLGIYSDTGGFKYESTRSNTFRAAAHLAEIAPNYQKMIFSMENNRMPGTIRFEALALSSVKTYFGGQVALASLSNQELTANNLGENDAAPISIPNILKSVNGWNIGVSLLEWSPGVTGVSARTRDSARFDLTKFITLIGGGGHKVAAGAKINLPLALAKNLVLEKIGQAYPELVD